MVLVVLVMLYHTATKFLIANCFKREKEHFRFKIRMRLDIISPAMIENRREVVLEVLPLEIQEIILSYLSAKDLFSVAKTSRYFSSLTKKETLWTKLTLDWKDIFQNFKFCKDLIQNRYIE